MANTKHRRPSVETRNANVIRRVMKEGASKTEICAEYHIKWDSLRDSIRNKHYHLDTKPSSRNQKLYEQFCAQAAANEAKAAVSSSVASNKTTATATATSVKNESITISAEKKSTLYVVEPGFLLHQDFEETLSMDNGNAIFYIPRFCINELDRISESSREENKNTKTVAKSLVRKIYSEGIWGKRFISFKPQEQGFIEKNSTTESFKKRSFGIAEAAIELYLCGKCNVVVLTNSREVEILVEDFCKREDISDISVQRVRTFRPV